MALVNLFDIETPSGYKVVELHKGDFSEMDMEVDALVVSAFKSDYSPTPGTLLGSLFENYGVHLKSLAQDPEIDLRIPLNVWISKPIKDKKFKRIICIEIIDIISDEGDIEKAVKNLFSLVALAYSQDIKIETIAMPFIGTGNQEIEPALILPKLMELSKSSLENLTCLKKIIFFERGEQKTAILNDALNKYLKRTDFETSKYSIDTFQLTIKEDLLGYLIKLKSDSVTSSAVVNNTLSDLIEKIKQNNIKPYEIGVLCRRLVEFLVMDVLEIKSISREFGLVSAINELKNKGIASWVISYLHTLRTFGNVAAHSAEITSYKPPTMNEKDLITLFICLNRSLDFWLWYKNFRSSQFVEKKYN